ncbi:MAG TPA: hypothetical protein VF078_02185 [Nitrospira sp.]
MLKAMHQSRTIKRSMWIGIAIRLSLSWSLSHAGTTGNGRSAIEPATSDTMTSSAPTVTEAGASPLPSAAVSVENGLVLRTVPTVSKPISVGGTTLLPYIGAGFGGGYLTEFDRSLNPAQSASSGSFNAGQKNQFGQQLIPNEVQMGIRFPF